MSNNFELRILKSLGRGDRLQYRTKTKWYDGSTTRNGRRDWSDWKDVPKVWEEE